MPPRRRQRPLPRVYALLNAGVRLVAWLTSLAAVLMLAYVGKEWPSKGQVVIAGALGCAIAMLNDSWDMLATTDASMVVPRLAASRRVLHDLFSMALCVGGIIMMWVSNISLSPEKTSEQRRQEMWIMMALWTLIAVVAWRLIFAVWGYITSEYARCPQEGLETIFTGFGSTIKNFVNRHRHRRNKVLSVTVQVTLRRVTIGAVINLPPPVPGRGKQTRVFEYTVSAEGKEYPLRLWVKTSRGQFLDGEGGSSPEEPCVEGYYRASLHYARWMVESFYQFSS
ncbi:hypothetical protein NCS57_00649600 [Fusarium keratoplasticum]|uniref:Uncharacterized protein n=1 Tax=Fusarium keratoplasticum TaxID=1328300 RepID=A0ACC0R559_9HYPO|nr:hypothetical protein NCS57_00649600 [Fusarium keratoplasticum]KAI8671735.1 hypothetical protein NCS57_00649600 [Fusarium keratoplasticum]